MVAIFFHPWKNEKKIKSKDKIKDI